MNGTQKKTRNRATCVACQISKRKCDLSKPTCSQCKKKGIICTPSEQAQWRVSGLSTHKAVTAAKLDSVSAILETPISVSTPVMDTDATPLHLLTEKTSSELPIFEARECNDEDATALLPEHELGGQHSPAEEGRLAFDTASSGALIAHHRDFRDIDFDSWSLEGYANCAPLDFFSDIFYPTEVPVQDPHTGPDVHLPDNLALSQDSATPHLWNIFVTRIVAELTPLGDNPGNPFLRYLTSQAREEPGLFAAVLYLSQSIMRNCTSELLDSTITQADRWLLQSDSLGAALEDQATKGINRDSSYEILPNQTSVLLGQLFVIVTLCTAYISQGNGAKLQMLLESAFILAHALFEKLHENRPFLFLLKWLGYIHTTAMLSDGTYNIKAPDYVSISTVAQERSKNADPPSAISSLRWDIPAGEPSLQFLDVDPFIGISAATLTLMYKLGRLSRIRQAAKQSDYSSPWFWQDFESELDDLETRVTQQLYTIQGPIAVDGLSDLYHYNLALLLSVKLIFRSDLRGLSVNDREKEDIVGEILDICSTIPVESQVATLLVFPLFHAGMRSTRRLHQDFVRTRLLSLSKHFIVANITQAVNILNTKWATKIDLGRE